MHGTKSILVVEDDALVREAMQALLAVEGYGVAGAANGREALDYLNRAEPPLAILLDLAMPVMSGREFRERQQHSPELSAIPVVLISSETDLSQIATSLGVAGHHAKPVDIDSLLETIRVIDEPATSAANE